MSGSRASRRPLGLAAFAALGTVAIDQITKGLVRSEINPGETVDLILGVELVRSRNSGVAFGLLGDVGALPLILIACVFVAGLTWFLLVDAQPGSALPAGLLAGGAIGNIVDRVRDDAVTDFIDPPSWPAFNVADIAITVGVALLLFQLLRTRPDG